MQAKLRLLARRQDDPECRRDACQEPLEQTKRVGRVQLVQIVDDQHNRILEQRQIRQQLVDQRLAGKPRCRSHTPDRPLWAGAANPSMTDSQKRWASCSSRATDTQAGRSPETSSHERNSMVLPLPADAQTSASPPGGVTSNRSKSCRRCTAGTVGDGRWRRGAPRSGGGSCRSRSHRVLPGVGESKASQTPQRGRNPSWRAVYHRGDVTPVDPWGAPVRPGARGGPNRITQPA